jgi:hypothetical protein
MPTTIWRRRKNLYSFSTIWNFEQAHKLKERMNQSDQVLVLVGDKTKNLYRFVRWELELALEIGLPIIVVNLSGGRGIDKELCPPIIRDVCAVHVPFQMAIIQHALDHWPGYFRSLNGAEKAKGPQHYVNHVYGRLGL